jgi:hypothetical protein
MLSNKFPLYVYWAYNKYRFILGFLLALWNESISSILCIGNKMIIKEVSSWIIYNYIKFLYPILTLQFPHRCSVSLNLLNKKGKKQHPIVKRQQQDIIIPFPILFLVIVSAVLLHCLHVAICGVFNHWVG